MFPSRPENYVLSQRGRARVDFLIELGLKARTLECQADDFAQSSGLSHTGGPTNPEALHAEIGPIMQQVAAFRIFRLVREWQLAKHGAIAMEAFDEIRVALEPSLKALQDGPTDVRYAADLGSPDYWDGFEFHRSAGGWDGHDYMGVADDICSWLAKLRLIN